MITHLLDTNIVSDLVRHPNGVAVERLARLGSESVCTSIIVAAELRYGAIRKKSQALTSQLEIVLSRLPVLPFAEPADQIYGEIRASLEQAGRVIGQHDMLIAAHALAADCTLVTDNGREFTRVKSLRVENWLR